MKTVLGGVVFFLLLLNLWVAPKTGQLRASDKEKNQRAALLRCTANDYLVTAYSPSAGLPSISLGTPCGQALAMLGAVELKIDNAVMDITSASVVYTFMGE